MKLHIMGPPGAGKTRLARWAAEQAGVTPAHLDMIVQEPGANREWPSDRVEREIAGVLVNDVWVTDGDYRGEWVRPILEAADLIVWLDFGWPTCAMRMIKRQLRRAFTSGRAYGGWRRMSWMLAHTWRYRKLSDSERHDLLAPYAFKLIHCRSNADVAAAAQRLEPGVDHAAILNL